MPDQLTADGLEVKTLPEITADLKLDMERIYGDDINLESNSPDGQLIGILAQQGADMRELVVQVNAGFDPDRAVGRILDERVVINNISRRGGTFTIQPITLVINATVALQGLDAQFNSINGVGYTVQDNAGNQFILVDSETFPPGTYSRNFRARNIGQVETIVNTITNPVTIVSGVSSVNNPSAPLSVGQNEETDAQLRIRRRRSVSINSRGYLNGLLGAVLELQGVSEARLYENVTNSVDGNGIPAHGIWLVVEGGANTEIADEIYERKSYGANMKGAVTVDITTPSNFTFTARFDRPTAVDLYIKFDIQPIVAIPSFDLAAIKQFIIDNLTYGIGDYAETSRITEVARLALIATGNEGVAVNVEISDDDIAYVDYLVAPTLDSQWVIDATRIDITVLP